MGSRSFRMGGGGMKYLIIILFLFSCKPEPLCEHKQDPRLQEYWNIVLDRLESDFPRECAVLKLDFLTPFNVATTTPYGITFDRHYFELYTFNGYSQYIELVMLHEVMHVLGYTKEDFTILFQSEYSEEEMTDYYERAKELI